VSDDATTIRSALVLGTGTMGRGIAQVCATAGIAVRLVDAEPARVSAAIASIGASLGRAVDRGKLAADARAAALGRLSAHDDVEGGCSGVDLVIEAVPESMDLKVGLLARVVGAAPPSAIVASNTSSLSITELGTRIGATERTIGLHFFNPPPVMELLEIVRGLGTSEATVDTSVGLARRLGKTPIVVNDVPGFATSRLGVCLGAEAIRMLESGVAGIEDIDRAMKLGYRHPMGPLELTDLVGLDVRLSILEHLHRELGEQFRPPALLRQMVRAGRLGKKAGIGFYRWTDEGAVPAPVR
jgi:3-hydroxybutyryl-CoA dehydrogenase